MTIVSKEGLSARILLKAGAFAAFAAAATWAQPTPAPTKGDLGCKTEAEANAGPIFTGPKDADGFQALWNGKDFTGWSQSCVTAHSGSRRDSGAIFRVGTLAAGGKAIYSTQRGTTAGGVMMTNKKFKNYEIRFQIWPDFGNDGGIFNRTPYNGRCYKTTLSYINGASMGGVWGEGGFTGRDFRPFAFAGNEAAIAIPGNNAGPMSNWTTITRDIKATTQPNLPCPTAGCTQANWQTLWDRDGWNDFRVQFYGGTDASNKIVTMKSWFKKPSSNVWVPLIQDKTLSQIIPDGRIGFQVHGGGRFGAPKGTWYRNIRWRDLNNQGNPIAPPPESATGVLDQEASTPFAVNAFGFSGMSDVDYTVQVMDAQGRLLQTVSGKAGPMDHAFTTPARGLLFLKVKTAQGITAHRVVRPF